MINKEEVNIWVRETLMCGAKKIPLVGPAVEVVSNVQARRTALNRDARLNDLETRFDQHMSRFDQRIHAVVQELITDTMQQLAQPSIDGTSLQQLVNEFRQINEHGYHTLLFEGLFENGDHFQALKTQPNLYGQLLDDHQVLPQGTFPIFLDMDKTRLLAVPPAALSLVLSTAHQEQAIVTGDSDIWALPASALPGQMGNRVIEPSTISFASNSPRRPSAGHQSSKH